MSANSLSLRIAAGIVMGVLLVRASLDTVLGELQLDLGGRGMSPGAAINILVIAIAAHVVLATSPLQRLAENALWLALLALCIGASLSSPDFPTAVRGIASLTTFPGMLAIAASLVRSEQDRLKWLDVIIYSSVIPCFVGLYQTVTLGLVEDGFRVQGTFAHPNIFAIYLVIVIAVVVFRPADTVSQGPLQKLLLLGYLGILCGLLILTKTRSAWVGAAFVVAANALLVDRRRLPLLIAGMPALLLVPAVRNRISDAGQAAEYIGQGVILNSYEWRQQLWHYAFKWIWERPLSGHGGLESFPYYSPQFFPLEEQPFNAHNVFVQLAFEVGLLGPALFAGVLAVLCWRFLRLASRNWRNAVMGIALTASYAMVCYSDNVLHYLAVNWYFWFALGCLSAVPAASNAAVKRVPSARHARSPLTGRLA